MLKKLIAKEVLNNLLNLRFALAYFLCTFLLVGSGAIMLSDYLAEKDVYDVNKSSFDRRLSGSHHPWGYLWANKMVLRPPQLTRIFALGGEKDADKKAAVAPEFSPYFHGDFKRNPLTNLFPSVDMVFIVGVIISLLVFVLTYDAVSGEREEGTLKLLLAGPVPRDQILAAKWLGGMVSLIIPLFTAWITMLLVLLFTPGISVSAGEWGRILVLLGVFTLYVATVFSMSLMVSLYFRNPGSAILALLFVWVTLIVAVPTVSPSLSNLLTKPRSVQKPQTEMLRVGVLEWGDHNAAMRETYIDWFGKRKDDELTEQERRRWRDYSSGMEIEHVKHIVDSIVLIGHNAARHELAVTKLARWIARLSPYGCLQNAAVALAGTGMERHQALRASVEEYSRMSTKYAADYIRSGRPHEEFRADNAPRATIAPVSFGSAVQNAALDIGILVIMGLLFFMAGYLRFVNSEVI